MAKLLSGKAWKRRIARWTGADQTKTTETPVSKAETKGGSKLPTRNCWQHAQRRKAFSFWSPKTASTAFFLALTAQKSLCCRD